MKRMPLVVYLLASMVLAIAGCGAQGEPGQLKQANGGNPQGCQFCACGWTCDVQLNACVIDPTDYCHNNQLDPNCETDKDCGGSCAERCDDGKVCLINADCKSGFCVQGRCVDSCHNKQLDPTESDVDCGSGPAGPSNPACPPCGDYKGCLADADCNSSFCNEGTPLVSIGGRTEKQHLCTSNPCTNGTWDPLWESDTDCGNGIDPATGLENPLRPAGGPPCKKCDDGKYAYRHTDCVSGLMDPGVAQRSIPGSTQMQAACNSSPCPLPGNKAGVPSTYYMADPINKCGDGIDNNGAPRPLPMAAGGQCPRCPTSIVNFGVYSNAMYPHSFGHPWLSTTYACNQDSDCLPSAKCNDNVWQYMEPGVPHKMCYPRIPAMHNTDIFCNPALGENFVDTPNECKVVKDNACFPSSGENSFNDPTGCGGAYAPPDMAVPPDMSVPRDMNLVDLATGDMPPWCGDKSCNGNETWQTCCKDCGCPQGNGRCFLNKCVTTGCNRARISLNNWNDPNKFKSVLDTIDTVNGKALFTTLYNCCDNHLPLNQQCGPNNYRNCTAEYNACEADMP